MRHETGSGLSNLSFLLGTSTEAGEDSDLDSHHTGSFLLCRHESFQCPAFSKGFYSLACGHAVISLKLAQMAKIFHFSSDCLVLIRHMHFYELDRRQDLKGR